MPNEKIVDYTIVCSTDIDQLTFQVGKLLEGDSGWQPYGSPYVTSRTREYHQAMVKYGL